MRNKIRIAIVVTIVFPLVLFSLHMSKPSKTTEVVENHVDVLDDDVKKHPEAKNLLHKPSDDKEVKEVLFSEEKENDSEENSAGETKDQGDALAEVGKSKKEKQQGFKQGKHPKLHMYFYIYQTQEKDSLWNIVRRFYDNLSDNEINEYVKNLRLLNPAARDRLLPKQNLFIPKSEKIVQLPLEHTVQEGETLRSIAKNYYNDKSAWYLIFTANQIKNPEVIRQGEVLRIPDLNSVLQAAEKAAEKAKKQTLTAIDKGE